MEQIGIRELRNNVSQVVRRARAGERIVITVDGVPAAQLGPLPDDRQATLEELIAAGLVRPPRVTTPPPPARPVPAPPGPTTTEILDELRGEL